MNAFSQRAINSPLYETVLFVIYFLSTRNSPLHENVLIDFQTENVNSLTDENVFVQTAINSPLHETEAFVLYCQPGIVHCMKVC